MNKFLTGLFLTLASSAALAQFQLQIDIGQSRGDRSRMESNDRREHRYENRRSELRRSRYGINNVCRRFEDRRSNRSCFMDFDGQEQAFCQVCVENKSCFMAFDGDTRAFCEAYKENKSCFMALDGEDRGWCEVLKEGKSCFMALDGDARVLCERGHVPRRHRFWLN